MNLETWNISGRAFHFGRHGLGQEESSERMTSDSLFAALVACLAQTRGPAAVEPWLEQYQSSPPPFVLSSAFPRAGGVRFYPTPLLNSAAGANNPNVRPKDLKRLRYVSEAIFRGLIQGSSLADAYSPELVLQGQVLVSKTELALLPAEVRNGNQPIWQIERRARVTIGRAPVNSALFFTGEVVFGTDCGLWFGLRWFRQEAALQKDLEELFLILGSSGLGGERSSGFGSASIGKREVVDLPDGLNRPWISLSHYLPAPDEMSALQNEQAAYTLEAVGGWVNSPGNKSERRRTLRMLAEGSAFGALPKAAPGQLVDVQPDYNSTRPLRHAVWRNGLALAVGRGGST